MLFILRDGDHYRIDIVELMDGCCPRMTYDVGAISANDGARSPPPTEDYYLTKLRIEPAIWGMILILDKICVDCKRRRFTWATTSSFGLSLDDEGTDDPLYKTHYAEDECYEYDDNIDELFKLAERLITISNSRTKSHRESHEEQSCLIRMLYCFVLPKVQIYRRDICKVDKAIQKQMSCIKKIDQDIERHTQVLEELYRNLHKQQDERLIHFVDLASEKKCSKNFVTVLNADLSKRADQLRDQINENQGVVQEIKLDIHENGTTEEKEMRLTAARKHTARLDNILQGLRFASEDSLKEALRNDDFPPHDNENLVLDYLKCKEMREKQKIEAGQQMEKKVRATSILENLRRIKEEILEAKAVASATMSRTAGVRPTDVINDSHVPEYQTLSERVADIVKNADHPLGIEFMRFIAEVKKLCADIVEGVEDCGSSRKQNSTKSMDKDFLLVGIDGTIRREYLTPLEHLCRQIKEHFALMAKTFLEHFSSSSQVLGYKLQLCYEENFYDEVGKDISTVYKRAHEEHKVKMIRDLESLSTYPIGCLELGMKDEWWLELFEKRRQATVLSRSTNRMSKSLEIREVSRIRPGSSLSSGSSSSLDTETCSNVSDSEKSSISGKSTQESPTVHRKPSPGKITDFFRFMRRKSKEVVKEMVEGERNGWENQDTKSRDKYGARQHSNGVDTSDTMKDLRSGGNISDHENESEICKANKMSHAIQVHDCNGNTNGSAALDKSLHELGISVQASSYHSAVTDLSTDDSEVCRKEDESDLECEAELLKFAEYFGPSLDSLKDIFEVSSVFGKLKCLTKSLRHVTQSVQELRRQVLKRVDDHDHFSLAITGDDILPLIVLMMLQMENTDAAAIVGELKMMEDLIPKFLSSGCHGWALMEYQMASQVLMSLCESKLQWHSSFAPRHDQQLS